MNNEIKISIEKPGLRAGTVMIEDACALMQGFNDAITRLIQSHLGYKYSKRPNTEAKKLSKIVLTAINSGSGVLVCEPLPVEGISGRSPAMIAFNEIINGINYFNQNNSWPLYFTRHIRNLIKDCVSSVIRSDDITIRINSTEEDGKTFSSSINSVLKDALITTDVFSTDTPVELVGKIFNINIANKTCKIDTNNKKITIEAGDRLSEIDSDDLRWQRVYIKGIPKDRDCNCVGNVQELRLATDDEDDGIEANNEETNIETLPNYQNIKQRLESFERLEQNWNSYNAPAINPRILKFSLLFINETYNFLHSRGITIHEAFVTPTVDGGIQFEWEKDSRELEIEIADVDDFRFLKICDGIDYEGQADRWHTFRLIHWLFTGETE